MIYVVQQRSPITGPWALVDRPGDLEEARISAKHSEDGGYEARIVGLVEEIRGARGEAVVVYRTPYALHADKAQKIWEEYES